MSQVGLNHNVGIQSILDSRIDSHIPTAKPLASTLVNTAKLDEHFAATSTDSLMESALTPDVGDGTSVRPDQFHNTLQGISKHFEGSNIPSVQNMVDGIIKPSLENKDLLRACSNLMIGG